MFSRPINKICITILRSFSLFALSIGSFIRLFELHRGLDHLIEKIFLGHIELIDVSNNVGKLLWENRCKIIKGKSYK